MRWGSLALLGLALGCAAATRSTRAPSVALRSPAVAPDFRHRQEVTVTYGEKDPRSFEAVLEKSGERLRLVGLTPLSTVLFVIELEGGEVRFENRTGEELPFDPSYILLDVQRAFFPWLAGEVKGGRREGEVAERRVVERFEGDDLVERVFLREGRPPVRAVFSDAGREVTLMDPELGYRLRIRTFE